MAKIPQALHQHINEALFPNTPLVGSVDRDGYPRISMRGSTCVYDGDTLAFWERSFAGLKESIETGAKLTVFFQKPELRQSILPIVGVARFFGTAEVHKSGPGRDKVYALILEAERQKDPEKKRFAVLLRVERAEDLRGAPLTG
jgi:hypothetical protein